MLASSGEITEPCPVPFSLTVTIPSSSTPAFSHFWIRRMMRGSPTRCSTKRTTHSLLTSSKEYTTDYPSRGSPKISGDYARTSPVRGSVAFGNSHHPTTRRASRSRDLAERNTLAHSGRLDRLEQGAGFPHFPRSR